MQILVSLYHRPTAFSYTQSHHIWFCDCHICFYTGVVLHFSIKASKSELWAQSSFLAPYDQAKVNYKGQLHRKLALFLG